MESTEPLRILVVDDNIACARVIGRILPSEGFEVALAYDGFEALQQFDDKPPSLVVLDILMLGLDGLQVLDCLSAKYSVPVIVITAVSNMSTLLSSCSHRIDDYLIKPFTASEFISKVHRRLRTVSLTGT